MSVTVESCLLRLVSEVSIFHSEKRQRESSKSLPRTGRNRDRAGSILGIVSEQEKVLRHRRQPSKNKARLLLRPHLLAMGHQPLQHLVLTTALLLRPTIRVQHQVQKQHLLQHQRQRRLSRKRRRKRSNDFRRWDLDLLSTNLKVVR